MYIIRSNIFKPDSDLVKQFSRYKIQVAIIHRPDDDVFAQALQEIGHAGTDPERGSAETVVHLSQRDATDTEAASHSPGSTSAATAREAAGAIATSIVKGESLGQRKQG